MPVGRVNAAKYISRHLGEPHETDFSGEEAHHLIATVHADRACPPSGHRIGWNDCYLSADMLPLTWKADLLLEPNGDPRPISNYLTREARERAVEAGRLAARIRREAHRRGLH